MEIIEQGKNGSRRSWQLWAVWLARCGYSDFERSVLMTAQHLTRFQEQFESEHAPVALEYSLVAAAD